jgi:thiol-disulfide isomerase/thioredoxin
MIRAALSLAVAVLAGLLAYVLLPDVRDAPRAAGPRGLSGAPAFSVPLLNRGRVGGALGARLGPGLADGRLKLAELRGVPVMIDVWASWCPSCREQAPVLQRAWREDLRPRGVLLLGLNIKDVAEDARAFIRSYGIDFPNVRDWRGTVAPRYGITGIPEMFMISRRGRIVEHVVGSASREELRAAAAKLTAAP